MANIENLQNNVQVSVNTNIIDNNFTSINSELEALNTLVSTLASTVVPTGTILPFAGSVAPANAIICDGRAVLRSGGYAKLFSIIGTAYGSGNGTTTFNVPDLKGKIPVGLDNSVSPQVEFNSLGKSGGAKVEILDTTKIPNHSHNIKHSHSGSSGSAGDHGHNVFISTDSSGTTYVLDKSKVINAGLASTNQSSAIDTGMLIGIAANAGGHSHSVTVDEKDTSSATDGGNGASPTHNNLQPYVVTNYIIIAQ